MARLLLQSGGYEVVGRSGQRAEADRPVPVTSSPNSCCSTCCCPTATGPTSPRTLAALPNPPGVVLTSSHPQGGFGAQLSTLPVLGFVPKEELTVARLAELFG